MLLSREWARRVESRQLGVKLGLDFDAFFVVSPLWVQILPRSPCAWGEVCSQYFCCNVPSSPFLCTCTSERTLPLLPTPGGRLRSLLTQCWQSSCWGSGCFLLSWVLGWACGPVLRMSLCNDPAVRDLYWSGRRIALLTLRGRWFDSFAHAPATWVFICPLAQ